MIYGIWQLDGDILNIQWGFPYNTGDNYFPITYSTISIVTASGEYSSGSTDNNIVRTSIDKFKANGNQPALTRYWMAVGY